MKLIRFVPQSLALCALASVAHAGVTYRTMYAAPTNHVDQATALAPDGNGGQILVGSAYSSTNGTYDMHVVATSKAGAVQWVFSDRVTGESEIPYAVTRFAATNTFRALSTARGGGASAIRVSSYNSFGQRLFQTTVPIATTFLHKPSMALDSYGNAYVATVRGGECLLVKIDPNGILLWDKLINWGTGTAEGLAVTVDGAGSPVVVGTRMDAAGGYTTAKVTTNGDLVWHHTYFGNHGSILGKAWVQPTSDGDFIVCGSPETSFGVPQLAIWRLRGTDGAQLWLRTYATDPTKDAEATDMTLDSKNNAYACSFRVTSGTAGMILKYSPTGELLWERQRLGGSFKPLGIAVDLLGNPIMCGFSASGTATGQIVAYDTNGALLWTYSKAGDTYADVVGYGKGIYQLCGYGTGTGSTDMVAIGALSPTFSIAPPPSVGP